MSERPWKGKAYRELERERDEALDMVENLSRAYNVEKTKLARVREWREMYWDEIHRPGGPRIEKLRALGLDLDRILDGEGE